MLFPRDTGGFYMPVPNDDNNIQKEDHDQLLTAPRYLPRDGRYRVTFDHGKTLLSLNIIILLLSCTLFVLSLTLTSAENSLSVKNYLLRKLSHPSPLLRDIDIPIRAKTMDATLVERLPLSIFRQYPSKEVDEAWQRIGDTRPIPLSRDDIIAAGKNSSDSVKFPESFGLGPDVFAGRVDVFHQIHCLDTLRREAYFEHYYGEYWPGGLNDTDDMHRLHVSHCIYFLLQNIMCQASTDVYTHIWTDTPPHPYPDFGTDHQCKDFDAILHWQQERAVNQDDFVALRVPSDFGTPRVMNHRFKEVNRYFESHNDSGDVGGAIG